VQIRDSTLDGNCIVVCDFLIRDLTQLLLHLVSERQMDPHRVKTNATPLMTPYSILEWVILACGNQKS
jgi:hypothetical protein